MLGLAGVGLLALVARLLARWDVPVVSVRLIMLAVILLCPVLLGLAIGAWGGERGGTWGARGVSALYVGVVMWAWAADGVFPVGFRLPGFPTPLFVTLTNMGIFVVTMYFMQTLGRSGGRLGSRLAAAPRSTPIPADLSSSPERGASS